jgi:hypothetical protein
VWPTRNAIGKQRWVARTLQMELYAGRMDETSLPYPSLCVNEAVPPTIRVSSGQGIDIKSPCWQDMSEVHTDTVPITTVPFDRLDSWKAGVWPSSRPAFHGLGGHEHLGDEQLAGAEAFADLVHGADQTVVQDDIDVRAAVQFRLGLGLDRFLVKCQYCVEISWLPWCFSSRFSLK